MSGQNDNMAGTAITMNNGELVIPNNPIIYFIEGDGIGIDISPVMQNVVDAAIKALKDGHHGYTSSNGIKELRTAVADDFYKRNNVEIDPDDTTIRAFLEVGEETFSLLRQSLHSQKKLNAEVHLRLDTILTLSDQGDLIINDPIKARILDCEFSRNFT